MYINNFVKMTERNLFVQWFRANCFKKGSYLPDRKELGKITNLTPREIEVGIRYLCMTEELLEDERGLYILENDIEFVENQGWVQRGRLICGV